MKYLIALFALLSLNAHAATTISTTLTLTSPSAIISMTGVSATAYLRNISATAITATQGVVTGSVSATNISATAVAKAWVKFNGNSGAIAINKRLNIATVTRINTGAYGVSFTTPMADANYAVICTPQRATANELFATLVDSPSPTTAGFLVNSSSAGGLTDTGAMYCVVFD